MLKLPNIKILLSSIVVLLMVLAISIPDTNAARTDGAWQERLGSYLETAWPEGRDILINGVNKYLNFGVDSGSSGYGIRDNAGTMECKDAGGSWSPCQDGGGSGDLVGPASATDNAIARYDSTTGKLVQDSGVTIDDSGNMGIGTTTPASDLHVFGNTNTNIKLSVNSVDSSISIERNDDARIGELRFFTAGSAIWRLGQTQSDVIPSGSSFFIGSQASQAGGGNSEFLITSTGNVGIGTTSPYAKLSVNGDSVITDDLNVGGDFSIQDWSLSTSTVVCMAPEVCEFQADGTADDVQIQAAINATPSGVVFIKDGTYNFASSINLSDNLVLRGESWNTILSYNSTIIGDIGSLQNVRIENIAADLNDSNGQFIVLSSNDHENIYVTNVYITGINNSSGASFRGSNIHFENNTLDDVLNGVSFADTNLPNATIYVSGNDIRNLTKTTVSTNEFGEGIEINMHNTVNASAFVENNYIEGFGEEGIDVNIDYFIVSGNEVVMDETETRGSHGITAGANPVLSTGVLSNNIIRNANSNAIYVYMSDVVTIQNNTIVGTSTSVATTTSGIRLLNSVETANISGNTFDSIDIGINTFTAATANLNIGQNSFVSVTAKERHQNTDTLKFSIGTRDKQFNTGLELNGSSAYMLATTTSYLHTQGATDPITLSWWFNTDDATYSGSDLNQLFSSQYTTFSFRDNFVRCRTNNGGSQFSYIVDTWYHAVCTYDGTNTRLYINGELNDADNSVQATAANRAGAIGKIGANTSDGRYFDGTIDEPMVWDRTLSAGEVAALYANGTTSDGDAVGIYLLDEGSGTTAIDSSSAGDDATITNATFTETTLQDGKIEWVNGQLIVNANIGIGTTAPTSKLSINGSRASLGYTTITNGTTAARDVEYIYCDAASGIATSTLPTLSTTDGRVYYFKKTDSSSNNCILDGNGSETIDGALTATLTTQYQSIQVHNRGTEWAIH